MNKFEAIYDVMHEQGIIEDRMFGLCLGKNGGYFQIGGYDKSDFIEDDVTWLPLTQSNADFKVRMQGAMMNNHFMAGSEALKIGFIDSGTTFTYVPKEIYNALKTHFEWFCSVDPENHCKGKMEFTRRNYLCFSYDE